MKKTEAEKWKSRWTVPLNTVEDKLSVQLAHLAEEAEMEQFYSELKEKYVPIHCALSHQCCCGAGAGENEPSLRGSEEHL